MRRLLLILLLAPLASYTQTDTTILVGGAGAADIIGFQDSVLANDNVFSLAHIDMHVTDSALTIPITQNVYTHVTNPTNTLFAVSDSKAISFAGDSIIVDAAGLYRFHVHLSFEGSNNAIYECALAINDVIDIDHKFTRKTSSSDVGDASFGGLMLLSALDSIKLMIRNIANNADLIIVNACLILNRIDE